MRMRMMMTGNDREDGDYYDQEEEEGEEENEEEEEDDAEDTKPLKPKQKEYIEIDLDILKDGARYACEFEGCVYRTIHAYHMKRHLQTIHVRLKYRCTLCYTVSYSTRVRSER